MKLLAFDTSSSAYSLALLNDNEVKVIHEVAPMQQSRLLLPAIEKLLQESSVALNQLDAIAFGCGPGSFTGIRIAASTAQALGYAAKLPLISLSSLAILAQTAFMQKNVTHSLVALDARMEQIYWAEYVITSHGLATLIHHEQICAPQNIITSSNHHDWSGIGEGWQRYQTQLISALGSHPQSIYSDLIPHANAMIPLARAKFEQKEWVTPENAVPIYLK